ncbi:MAG: hypothetical protein M1828_003293 [Chrysothrix sp. TS-e1954]|nr:MAG: hypothetical protein M1828_003293 [Chrysothrix sp. TS-e1954]
MLDKIFEIPYDQTAVRSWYAVTFFSVLGGSLLLWAFVQIYIACREVQRGRPQHRARGNSIALGQIDRHANNSASDALPSLVIPHVPGQPYQLPPVRRSSVSVGRIFNTVRNATRATGIDGANDNDEAPERHEAERSHEVPSGTSAQTNGIIQLGIEGMNNVVEPPEDE